MGPGRFYEREGSMRLLSNKKRVALLGLTSLAAVATITATLFVGHGAPARAATGLQVSFTHLKAAGTGGIASSVSGASGVNGPEIAPQFDKDDTGLQGKAPAGAPTTAPNPRGNGVANNNPGATGFAGVNHFDNRFGSNLGNNQFSLEPPDQGLCVGNGFVIDAVNDVVGIYNAKTHARIGVPTALNSFFGLAPAIIRSNPPVFGSEATDPKCLYDAQTHRFFATTLILDQDAVTGAFTGNTRVLIGVSQSADPTGAFNIFSIDTTNGDGTVPGHPGCPCLGDQPLIGADANGVYISTNEFPFFQDGFNGTQLYAMSKSALVNATAGADITNAVATINVGQTITTPDAGGIWGSLQPATTPPGGHFETASGGTEYFLASLDFFGTLDNRIAAWALTNTSSLNNSTPSLGLQHVIIGSETYGQPGFVPQKAGSTPLGDLLGLPEGPINANDDRMNQVVFADGKLFSGVNTTIGDGKRAGIAYFIVQPKMDHGTLTAKTDSQGYVSVDGNSVVYPSIGVNPDGNAVMSFSLVGPDFFPSAAYVTINGGGHASKVHVSGAGVGPQDGFEEYPQDFGGRPRWGDYSAAVADESGTIWLAAESINQTCDLATFEATNFRCDNTRSQLANWGTFITNVNPSDDGEGD